MKDWENEFYKEVADGNNAVVVTLSESKSREKEFSPVHYAKFISSLYSLGLKERAEVIANEAVNVFPQDLSLRILYAENSMSSAEWDKAIQAWKYIIDNFVSYPEGVLWRLANTYNSAYRFHEAKNIVEVIRKRYGESQRLEDLISFIESTEAKKYIVSIKKRSKEIAYSLDHIYIGDDIGRINKFLEYHLYGWVKIPQGKEYRLILKNGDGQISYHDLNVVRQDVKRHFEKKNIHDTDVQCGFDYIIDVTSGLSVGLQLGEKREWLFQIDLHNLSNVLEGKSGWLFLDNDINKSVDQFTGKALLSNDMLSAWERYADQLLEYQRQFNLVHFIASSKEAVFPQYYPYEKASVRPFDQVREVLKNKKINSLNATEVMSRHERTYYETDTHWSDYGAYLAYSLIMKENGFEEGIIKPGFKEVEAMGDLGSKFYPIRKSLKKVHTYSGAKSKLVFDNGVPGTGSIRIRENPGAYYSGTAVLFGDSFMLSGRLFNYFTYSFGRVVFLNMPGSLVESVLNHESPDIVVVQTNERYLLKPGTIYKQLGSYESPVFTKTASLSTAKKRDIENECLSYSNETFYKGEMSRIFDNIFDR